MINIQNIEFNLTLYFNFLGLDCFILHFHQLTCIKVSSELEPIGARVG